MNSIFHAKRKNLGQPFFVRAFHRKDGRLGYLSHRSRGERRAFEKNEWRAGFKTLYRINVWPKGCSRYEPESYWDRYDG